MRLTLIRDSYGDAEVLGKFVDKYGDVLAHTIERPWVEDDDYPGGVPFESCIPDGLYKLVKYTRTTDGSKVVALINPRLGVWFKKSDRPEDWGRYKCLIHAGNYVENIVGCVAPGRGRTIYNNRRMVTSSRATMRKLNVQRYTSLLIKRTEGAV